MEFAFLGFAETREIGAPSTGGSSSKRSQKATNRRRRAFLINQNAYLPMNLGAPFIPPRPPLQVPNFANGIQVPPPAHRQRVTMTYPGFPTPVQHPPVPQTAHQPHLNSTGLPIENYHHYQNPPAPQGAGRLPPAPQATGRLPPAPQGTDRLPLVPQATGKPLQNPANLPPVNQHYQNPATTQLANHVYHQYPHRNVQQPNSIPIRHPAYKTTEHELVNHNPPTVYPVANGNQPNILPNGGFIIGREHCKKFRDLRCRLAQAAHTMPPGLLFNSYGRQNRPNKETGTINAPLQNEPYNGNADTFRLPVAQPTALKISNISSTSEEPDCEIISETPAVRPPSSSTSPSLFVSTPSTSSSGTDPQPHTSNYNPKPTSCKVLFIFMLI